MSNGTKVLKRNGQTESLNLDKIHKITEEACEGLAGVSASQVEINSGIQFYDGITTAEIQEILVKSASDLIDLAGACRHQPLHPINRQTNNPAGPLL